MIRVPKNRRSRKTRAAGAAALLLLSLLGLYAAVQTGLSTSQTSQTIQSRNGAPLGSAYGYYSNGSRGTYWTPVGSTTFAWGPPSDVSLVYGPVVDLSEALKLSGPQVIRIQAIQQQTQQTLRQEQQTARKSMDTLFQEIRHTQTQKARWLLPFSDPVSYQVNEVIEQMSLPQREQRMKSLFDQMEGVEKKTSKRLKQIDQGGSDEIEKVLDASQRAALPRLMAGMSVFRRLSLLPAERYVTLALSEDQRRRLSALAQEVATEQLRQEQEMTAPSRLGPSMTLQQRRSIRRMRARDFLRLSQRKWKDDEQVRQKALAILAPPQRHPPLKSSSP